MTPTAAWEAADPVDEETSRGVYSIGAVSTMVGVPQATLRTWEARYGGISPERTGSGHRLYTREQVARLRFVVSQTRRGMTAADAHRSLVVQRCSRRGTRLLMTIESPELFGIARLPEVPLSQIADNVVLLQFVRREWDYRRAMVVLKSRGAQVDPGLNEYVIGSTGIEVLPRRPSASERPSRVNAGSAR
jgi:DNA-binding transcriptional MerR regulator